MSRPPTHWTPRALGLLGKVPDRVVADLLGCTPATVLVKRRALGVPPARSANWTPERDARLGTATDQSLADEWGLTLAAVFHRRRALGIPASGPRGPRPTAFTPAMDALLGTVPDSDLAREWGLCASVVGNRRRALGVPPLAARGRHRRPRRADDPAFRADLAALTNAQVARKYGISDQRVDQLRDQAGVPHPAHRNKQKGPGDRHGPSAVLGHTDAGGYRLRCRCGKEFEVPCLKSVYTCGTCTKHPDRRDVTGQRIPGSRLTARRRVDEGSNLLWEFDCDCGTAGFVARLSNVLQGLTKSCGCLRAEYLGRVRDGGFGWGPGGRPEGLS